MRALQSRLAWKIFLSYLLIILVGVLVMATAVQFVAPSAFDRHLASMAGMMQPGMGMRMEDDLSVGFNRAVNEALLLSVLAALAAAVAASALVTRQVVAPIRQMRQASQRIAEGHYRERVDVSGDPSNAALDELGQLALSFNQMADRLERTEEARRQLIANVAHEQRTPLTIIKGTLESLIDGVAPAEAETFHQVYREVGRLERLVSDLQELSRVEAGAFDLALRPLLVEQIFEAVASRLGPQFEEKGVALRLDPPQGAPQVTADEDRIGQVLLNLVGNALQYTPSGGEVTISARREKGSIEIAVADTGVGIAPEHLPHLFERFYRVDSSRSRAGGGTGIGLTIAKLLVEAHGGRIRADSAGSGRGSTFTITLPLAV